MSIDEKPEAMAHIPDRVHDQLNQRGLTVSPSGKVIWCNDAPTHPKNWSLRRKIYDTGIITLSVTVSALVGNTGTSAARAAETELALSAVVANLAFASMFFFGQAVGGLLMPPYTESFGRKTTNIAVSATHAVACIVVAAPQSLAAIVVGRFLSGFLSAVPTVVGSGSIEDMWDVRARIWAIDLWIKGSIVGIALGPCMATYIGTSFLGWHWIYYLSAILNSVVCLLFMGTHESRPSLLLARHVETVQRSTDFDELRFENADEVPSLHIFIRTMLIRPIRFFFTEPIVCAVSVISGTIFSSIYLQTEGLTVPYHEFGFDERGTSLVYLAWATGLLLTIPLRLNDWRIISRRIRRKEAVHPEDKLTGFFIASPILAAAFWCFSWTIPPLVPHVSPFVSIGSLVLVGGCTNEFDGILQGYLTDSYATYAASANAPLAFLRGILSGVFPLIGKQMFTRLGGNVAGSVLAGIATVFCLIAAWFWKYGASTREASKFAVSIDTRHK